MAKKSLGDLVGAWAFLIGVILAIVIGIFPDVNTAGMLTALIIIGIIIGLFNVADHETSSFLLSGVALVIVSYMGRDAFGNLTVITRILSALMTIFIPATIIVAIKNVLNMAKD